MSPTKWLYKKLQDRQPDGAKIIVMMWYKRSTILSETEVKLSVIVYLWNTPTPVMYTEVGLLGDDWMTHAPLVIFCQKVEAGQKRHVPEGMTWMVTFLSLHTLLPDHHNASNSYHAMRQARIYSTLSFPRLTLNFKLISSNKVERRHCSKHLRLVVLGNLGPKMKILLHLTFYSRQ